MLKACQKPQACDDDDEILVKIRYNNDDARMVKMVEIVVTLLVIVRMVEKVKNFVAVICKGPCSRPQYVAMNKFTLHAVSGEARHV